MTARLKLAQRPRRPTFAQIRRAVELYRSDLVPREVRKANARKLLAANASLGDRHLLKGGEAKWSGRRT